MADPFTAIAAISAVLGAVGQVKQNKAQRKQEKAQEKARGVEQARARRENQRLRRQQLRQQRIQRGEIIASGAGGNVLGSSGVQGGAGSVVSQAQSNISDIGVDEGFTMARNNFLDEGNKAMSSANRFASNIGIAQGTLALGQQGFQQYQSFQAGRTNPGGVSNQFMKDNPSYAAVMK